MSERPSVSRRGLLGAALGAGVAAPLAATAPPAAALAPPPEPVLPGEVTVPFFGEHQAGITATDQAHESLVALDLREGVDRAALQRLMRLLSDDAARLSEGRAALADIEPELADAPARLAFGFGFGPGFVAAAGETPPEWLAPLPAFAVDRLDPAICDGDLLIQVSCDDPLTMAHAVRLLCRDADTFASVRWTQRGYRRARGATPEGTTMRNLFGQVDGTAGPHPADDDYAATVWAKTGWLAAGTSTVVRRIAMNLDDWDKLGRADREHVIGRKLDTGAPVTGTDEFDEPDFAATDDLGFTVIKPWAHIRRARGEGAQQIARRSFTYDDGSLSAEDTGVGLVFVSHQADPVRQFVPIQRRLDELDLLNRWTVPVGSAVFAMPPGCESGGYIGETLLG